MHDERAILGALLEVHPGPMSRPELAAMLGVAIRARDAVGALVRDELANLGGDMVYDSRAAVRADQLRI